MSQNQIRTTQPEPIAAPAGGSQMTKEQKKAAVKKIYNALYKEYKVRAVAVKRTAKLTGVAVATVAFLTSSY